MPGEAFVPVAERSTRPERNVEEMLCHMFEWTDVAVNDYDPQAKLFSVTTLDGHQRKFKTPRIYTHFKADDPRTFVERVKNAIAFRKKCENQIK